MSTFCDTHKYELCHQSHLINIPFQFPEALAASRESYSGKMADIWQLGVTLYALVYGKVPFHEESIIKLYEKIQSEELCFKTTPEISFLLKNLLERYLTFIILYKICILNYAIHCYKKLET